MIHNTITEHLLNLKAESQGKKIMVRKDRGQLLIKFAVKVRDQLQSKVPIYLTLMNPH